MAQHLIAPPVVLDLPGALHSDSLERQIETADTREEGAKS
jgi:hypothetical protein